MKNWFTHRDKKINEKQGMLNKSDCPKKEELADDSQQSNMNDAKVDLYLARKRYMHLAARRQVSRGLMTISPISYHDESCFFSE